MSRNHRRIEMDLVSAHMESYVQFWLISHPLNKGMIFFMSLLGFIIIIKALWGIPEYCQKNCHKSPIGTLCSCPFSGNASVFVNSNVNHTSKGISQTFVMISTGDWNDVYRLLVYFVHTFVFWVPVLKYLVLFSIFVCVGSLHSFYSIIVIVFSIFIVVLHLKIFNTFHLWPY